MEEVLAMSSKEIKRLEVMVLLQKRKLKQAEAAKVLCLGVRQVKNLYANFKRHGAHGLVSKRRGRTSNHKISTERRERILGIVRTKYADFGPTLACEYLANQHSERVSVETLRQWMIHDELWQARQRRTPRVHQSRARRPCFGELVQMDGSPHDWFEGRASKCALLVLIDDATSAILGLRFETSETTFGYFDLLTNYFKTYGLPFALYLDKHGIFKVNSKEANSGNGLTEFGRAMDKLDVEVIHANTPQAKGRVERVNRTLQDRLIKAMRLEGISSMKAANAFLPKFIEAFNAQFARLPECEANAHRDLTLDDETLAHTLSLHSTRTLTKNLECSYKNVTYQIQAPERKYRLQHKQVTVCESRSGEVSIFHNAEKFSYKVFDKGNQPAKVVDAKSLDAHFEQLKPRKKTIPAKDHPWRNFAVKRKYHQQEHALHE